MFGSYEHTTPAESSGGPTSHSSLRMKKLLIPVLGMALSLPAIAQQAPKPYGALPSARQLKWHDTEMYCIVHFTPTTFEDKEWGYGDADPKTFNPSNFDAEQIIRSAKAGGFRGIVCVAKHHDGFCLWPTKTTDYNISKSPFRNGKGDMVRELEQACRKNGMKFAVYCSPWDRNNKDYGTDKYLATYQAQLRELYTNYGPVFMSWHDGANGGDGYYGGARETRKINNLVYYDWDNTWKITRELAPDACIFSDVGLDVRWVGNERGFANETSWATFTPTSADGKSKGVPGNANDKDAPTGTRNGKYWIPAECDVSLRPGWFYHESQNNRVKTPQQLLDLYFKSVGRGAALDLGLSPDKRGQLHDIDVASLKGLGDLLRKTFGTNIAATAQVSATGSRGKAFPVKNMLDNDRKTYWASQDEVTTPELTIAWKKPATFNIVGIREAIALGQRIDGFAIDVWQDGQWKEVHKGTSVGALRLVRLPNYYSTEKIRLRITDSPVAVTVAELGVYAEPEQLVAPVIRRDKDGQVTISSPASVHAIRYTIDGSEPTASSAVYTKPFELKHPGTVKAKAFGASGSGATESVQFDIPSAGWSIDQNAAKAIDGDPQTVWYSPRSGKYPHTLTLNLGQSTTLKGFTFLPDGSDHRSGTVYGYQVWVSEDGQNWGDPVAEGRFDNIQNSPIEQRVLFRTPKAGKYLRFTATEPTDSKQTWANVAELGVITK
ncbi:alpha-L-fucosidase [Siphonobacter aquaeclarae]|uniref:alpha-L-fucosidase n=2 Tax=Siphonobacter aquaeclarae TaxID=563176 RepID=A0A1G9MT62_9BACT|nr:alpha-L-fucosidase [Siphonobacter aquaeclarae]